MAQAVIGLPFTFVALFLDSGGLPFVPPNPTVEVFYFDSDGVKASLAAAGTNMSSVVGDTGRYTYTMTLPDTLTPAQQVYATMQGTDPGSGDTAVIQQEVDLTSGACGFTVSFIQPMF